MAWSMELVWNSFDQVMSFNSHTKQVTGTWTSFFHLNNIVTIQTSCSRVMQKNVGRCLLLLTCSSTSINLWNKMYYCSQCIFILSWLTHSLSFFNTVSFRLVVYSVSKCRMRSNANYQVLLLQNQLLFLITDADTRLTSISFC